MLRGTYSCGSFKPLGFPLRVKARVNKLNSPGIDWRCGLSVGIGLFFGFDIVASKEYCLTIVGSLEVWSRVTHRHATSGSVCSIIET